MSVSQEHFLIAATLLGLFFWILFARGKNKTLADETSKLNLREDKLKPQALGKHPTTLSPEARKSHDQVHGKARSLSVMFNYNGHTFEAYEILGLPAGANLEQIQEAYKKLKGSNAQASGDHDLIDAAYSVLNTEMKANQ